MSLSVPQNGVKPDNEPVIELFVKVRPQSPGGSFSFWVTRRRLLHCDDILLKFSLEMNVMSTVPFFLLLGVAAPFTHTTVRVG